MNIEKKGKKIFKGFKLTKEVVEQIEYLANQNNVSNTRVIEYLVLQTKEDKSND